MICEKCNKKTNIKNAYMIAHQIIFENEGAIRTEYYYPNKNKRHYLLERPIEEGEVVKFKDYCICNICNKLEKLKE